MAEIAVPNAIRQWMADRHWGHHHLEWHTARQWDLLSPSELQEAQSMGWARASRQEGEAGNGIEFLVMHRAMIELLREAFPADTALFVGWTSPPVDPNDPVDPVPPGSEPQFQPAMMQAIQRLTNGLNSFTDDDDFGRFLETSLRPVPGNPAARSPDPSAGIHNYMHNRFSNPNSPIDMGQPDRNLNNSQFWRLHGWIDSRWSALRRAKGQSDNDPALRLAIDREKQHLGSIGGHPHVMAGQLVARAVNPTRSLSASLRNPFVERPARRFQRLMSAYPDITTLDQLKDYLQTAASLELATLPIYLCAMWSLKNTNDAYRTIRGIAYQEMLHLGIVCNILKGIGGSPNLTCRETVPQFPDFLPGVDLLAPVDLRPFSRERLRLFMRIEQPANPIPPMLMGAGVPRYPTIGEFYAAIDRGLALLDPPMSTNGQLERDFHGESLVKVANATESRQQLKKVVEQGEGTPASQGATDFGGGLAHFYQFQQIDLEKKYVPQPNGTYRLDPNSPLPFPAALDIRDMAPVPDNGYPGVAAAEAFDRLYSGMLASLQSAWSGGGDDALGDAVGAMQQMKSAATALMDTPRADGAGNYGPAFRLILPPTPLTQNAALIRRVPRAGSAGAVSAAGPFTAFETAAGFARVQQILDEAVHGDTIGAHGPFWRTATRDQFVAKMVFGRKLITQRLDGSFDPDDSNLVRALEGRAPFGADLPNPPPGAIYNRMPDGYEPLPQAKIDEIRQWISAGCPDVITASPAWVNSNGGGPTDQQMHVDFWRDFDNWAMYQAGPAVEQAINVFFAQAPLWMHYAADGTQEPAWAAAVHTADMRAAVDELEARQRQTVVDHYTRPLPLLTLLDSFRRFGADSLPNDPARPDDQRHNMNGSVMWFMWAAFVDACLRLSQDTPSLPAPFWNGLARAILVGLLNDGLIRGRFTVNGFPATAAGQDAIDSHVRGLNDADLRPELLRRFRESGLGTP